MNIAGIVLGGIIVLAIGGGLGYWLAAMKKAKEGDALDASLGESLRGLEERFKAAAADALRANQEILLAQAQLVVQNAQGVSAAEAQKQTLELQKTVAPLQSALQKMEAELRGLEQARTVAYTGLDQHLRGLALAQKDLQTQAGALVQALREPKTRGNWGELQLKRVVEFAGMVNYVDFQEQVNVVNAEGKDQRPDMIVKLPNGHQIVVDAKVPLKAYVEAMQCQDAGQKEQLLGEHARQLKAHFKLLASKKYASQFDSPEFVVLFLNLESALMAALEKDPQLIEEAMAQQVLIATPTTLIALLKAVAYGWNEAKAADKAREMVELSRELMERFAVVLKHWQKVGASLGSAVEAYNDAASSTNSRLLVTARKIEEAKVLPEITRVAVRPAAGAQEASAMAKELF